MKGFFRLIQSLFSWLMNLFASEPDAGGSASYPKSSKKIIEYDRSDTDDAVAEIVEEEMSEEDVDDFVTDIPEQEAEEEIEMEETESIPAEPDPSPLPEMPKTGKSRSRSGFPIKESRSVFPIEEEEPSSSPNQEDSPVNAAPATQGDIVNMTVYSPEQVERGSSFLISVFAHLYEQRVEVEEMAKEMDAENKRQGGKTLNTPIERGSQLTFRLSIEDWELFEPVQQLTWFGQPSSVEFDVDVPEVYPKKKAIGTLIVSNTNGPVGRMRFNLSVMDSSSESQAQDKTAYVETSSQRYTQAYLSYAPEDQDIVDLQVEKLRENGIASFLNIKEDSDHWEDHAMVALRKSDVFLLFWSDAANQSEEVEIEYQTALGLRYGGEERLPDLIPIPVGDSWPDPPEDLAFLNFKTKPSAPNSLLSVNQEEEIEALKARCEQLMSEGKVEVFDLMRTYYQEDEDLVNDLYSLENQWNTLKRKQRLHLWSKEQIKQNQSKITFAVLGLIGEME
ncbi:MAG: TIR domain-containing protein [Bacteroidota bacterium]